MNAIGRDVARYPYHLEIGFITPSVMAHKMCGPGCPPVEIASTTFLKHGQHLYVLIRFSATFSESDFGKFYSLDSLRCVVYFYNRSKVICATSKHLGRDKCWKVGFSCVVRRHPAYECENGSNLFVYEGIGFKFCLWAPVRDGYNSLFDRLGDLTLFYLHTLMIWLAVKQINHSAAFSSVSFVNWCNCSDSFGDWPSSKGSNTQLFPKMLILTWCSLEHNWKLCNNIT